MSDGARIASEEQALAKRERGLIEQAKSNVASGEESPSRWQSEK